MSKTAQNYSGTPLLPCDSMSNGAVEKAVGQFMFQFRAIKFGKETRV